ncbi:MAG: ATP-binding cassette domain-containing protein [Thermoplasmatales archaeon]|nr:MAG: ATP-binding cassette domain-containing protein [Thermoplasmatales archaeon]
MIEKNVRCPKCHEIVSFSGEPGERITVTCPKCGAQGKVTFEKLTTDKDFAIEVSHLKKVYGNLIAVNDISFSIKKGDVFAFLGPNGAGKTTTVEMIESIRIPTAGMIKILSKDIRTNFDDVKNDIGVLPQEFHSFERLTVKETLVYFSNLYKKQANVDEIIEAMDLKGNQNQLYTNLSGGLKQRVGVAIALVNDPEIIFLDEPTTGLDPKARREVWNVIAGLKKKGKTIFLTTHYMEEAEYLADHIAIIHKGKIIAEGSLDELLNRYGKGKILYIKRLKTKNVKELLQQKGFEVTSEENGDIAVRITYKEHVIEVLSALRHDCIDYGSIDIKRSNLEEVFLHLTGSKLGEVAS